MGKIGEMGKIGQISEIDRQLKRMYPIGVGVATKRSESGVTIAG